MKRANIIIALVALAIAGVGIGLAWRAALGPKAPQPSAIGGPFHLLADDGRRVDQHVLDGKWSVVYFGYTFCPDVCPTTLAALGEAIPRLGAKAVQVIFITVDPARDTAGQLKTYLSNPSFPPGTLGLTGTEAEVRQAAAEYHVYFARRGTGADYTVDHTSILYLMDPEGRFVQPVAVGPPAAMAAQIDRAMSQGG